MTPTPTPLLVVRSLNKIYGRRWGHRRATFNLSADFCLPGPEIVGVMGPNGSGKTTLFELLAGSNQPTSGQVLCGGLDIHRVKYRERDRLVIHYHQSYQVRRVRKTWPSFLLAPAASEHPLVHIFDEPQFSTQDGYVGFMLSFFRKLRSEGRLVIICLHPNEPFQLEIMRSLCARYLFVSGGQVTEHADYDSLIGHPGVRAYLGALADGGEPHTVDHDTKNTGNVT